MKTKVLNYHIIVEKEKFKRGYAYVAHAPTLGVSDFGLTIDEAMKNIEEAMELYIESMAEIGNPIAPPDADEYFVANKKIEVVAPKLQFI